MYSQKATKILSVSTKDSDPSRGLGGDPRIFIHTEGSDCRIHGAPVADVKSGQYKGGDLEHPESVIYIQSFRSCQRSNFSPTRRQAICLIPRSTDLTRCHDLFL